MTLYLDAVYPAVLVVCAVLALVGAVTLIWIPAHRVLEWTVTVTYVAVAIQALVVILAMVSGVDMGIVVTIGYLLASVALLPLLGIGRLGHPDAAAEDPDPNRPVLAPDQIARVDGGAAVIVAIALAVVAWRIASIMGA